MFLRSICIYVRLFYQCLQSHIAPHVIAHTAPLTSKRCAVTSCHDFKKYKGTMVTTRNTMRKIRENQLVKKNKSFSIEQKQFQDFKEMMIENGKLPLENKVSIPLKNDSCLWENVSRIIFWREFGILLTRIREWELKANSLYSIMNVISRSW